MHKSKTLLWPFLLLALSACSAPGQSSSAPSSLEEASSQGTSSEESNLSEDSSTLEETSSFTPSGDNEFDANLFGQNPQLESSSEFLALFDPSSEISISLTFTKEALSAISSLQSYQNSTWSDIYFPADFSLTLNGVTYTYEEVGVRMKGNTSRGVIYEGDDITYLRHFKVKFNETFSDEVYSEYQELLPFKGEYSLTRDERTLFGLKKLDLKYTPRNSWGSDYCQVREVYAYRAFRKQGLLAPYANLCDFSFTDGNSSLDGTYELIEPIDKTFLKRRFQKSDAQGDLYKCVYNAMGKADLSRSGAVEKTYDSNGYASGKRIAKGKIGVEDNLSSYVPVYQLKTNDDLGENSDFSAMASYLNSIYSVTYCSAPDSVLESALDVDYFLRFSAVSYLLGNFDDQRYNYNNYYLYFLPSSGKALYIPYDYDWCLGLDTGMELDDSGPFGEATLDNGEACSVFYATFFKGNKNSQKTSYSRTFYQNSYLSYVEGYAPSVLDASSFSSLCLSYKEDTGTERSEVSSYMERKLQAI